MKDSQRKAIHAKLSELRIKRDKLTNEMVQKNLPIDRTIVVGKRIRLLNKKIMQIER